jgi:hypothetical protein
MGSSSFQDSPSRPFRRSMGTPHAARPAPIGVDNVPSDTSLGGAMCEIGREVRTIVIEPVAEPIPQESPPPAPETEPAVPEEEPART